MQFLILIKISIKVNHLFQIFVINFIQIWSNKSLNKIYNAKIFQKKYKTIYFGQIKKIKLKIRKFYLNSKKIFITKAKVILESQIITLKTDLYRF